MFNTIQELAKEREIWIESSRRNNFKEGISHLLTDLYPDNAHFIYELLQNAEDTKADTVRFTLSVHELEFEHNGDRLFSLEDVESITGIGVSTKRDDPTSIGKFGVGFKAVFAYTNTPEIHSGKFHFRIKDLVIPVINGVEVPIMDKRKTRFVFPFNHSTKRPAQAIEEIEQGLLALGSNTLLFLDHIRLIEYTLFDGSFGSLERFEHEGGHIEIRACHPENQNSISHWLRFQKEVRVVDEDSMDKECRIAIAFSLQQDNKKNTLSNHWKIVPLDHGQVSIYFPATQEDSHLRFHMHAPFASTVARDSVRKCAANQKLIDHIAELVVDSLVDIRDQGMLTMSLLATLPNPTDNLQPFYEPIRKSIVRAFSTQDLTPTKSGGYGPSKYLLRGPAKIADVIDDEDLAFLTKYDPPFWAANPPQQNQREDRFLDSLDIEKWSWEWFAEYFKKPHPYSSGIPQYEMENTQHIALVEDWVSGKDDAYLLRFYALLGEAYVQHHAWLSMQEFRVVRVEAHQGHKHVLPMEAFFPPERGSDIKDICLVKKNVYTAGRSDTQKSYARQFLEYIGVRPFDEKTAIECALARYSDISEQIVDSRYHDDVKKFFSFWKKNPSDASIFNNKIFLIGLNQKEELIWQTPENLCLDTPYLPTGLGQLTDIHGNIPIWPEYRQIMKNISSTDFVEFLKKIGVMHEIIVNKISTRGNQHEKILRKDYYKPNIKWTNTAIDEDYSMYDIDKYLNKKSVHASRLIWNALIKCDPNSATAKFRPNQNYQIQKNESQLVHILKISSWIPTNKNIFKQDEVIFYKPEEVTKDQLLDRFHYDESNGLLKAIGFGELARKRNREYIERNSQAQDLGFESAEDAETMAKLFKEFKNKGLSTDDIRSKLNLISKSNQPSFPLRPVANPGRREERIAEQIFNAPGKEYETHERSVRTTNRSIDPITWLRNQYTNENDQIVCQICKNVMPFRKRNGEYYCGKKEVLSRKYLPKEHVAQYLALCPLCAAKYHEFVSTVDDAMEKLKEEIVRTEDFDIPISLGDEKTSIRFVETHYHDLKAILVAK